jgi:hypothetical protein
MVVMGDTAVMEYIMTALAVVVVEVEVEVLVVSLSSLQ